MNNWREKIWLKIVALTIAGVFLFFEVTWAARADYQISLPEATNSNYPAVPQTNLGDFLWQIYQGISSFLVPLAHAEGTPFVGDEPDKVMPALDPDSEWQKPSEAVDVSMNKEKDTVESPKDEEKDSQEPPEDGPDKTQPLSESKGEGEQKDIPSSNFSAQTGQRGLGPLKAKGEEKTGPGNTLPNPGAKTEEKVTESAQGKGTKETEALKGTVETQVTPVKETEIALREEIQEPADSIQGTRTAATDKQEENDSQVKGTANKNGQKEETETQNEPLQAQGQAQPLKKDEMSICISGLQFLIPPLKDAVIPPSEQQSADQTGNEPKIEYNLQDSAALMIKGDIEDTRLYPYIEDKDKRIDILYESAPPTGPPRTNSGNTLITVTTFPGQGSGNSPPGEPVSLKGLVVSQNQTGITSTGQTALPATTTYSTLYNHGPPFNPSISL